MDVESLAKQLILKGMTEEQQTAVLESIKNTMLQARTVQKQRVGENVQVVVQALKKLEADIKARYDETGKAIEKRVASIKDGKDGQNGVNGRDGKDGRPGRDGAPGAKGNDGMPGRNGIDGVDGVSVTNAFIDFDGSLIINLSNGQDLNVGEVVAPDLAEKIKVITNGGGTSQQVLDTLASLQTQINNLIPSQTGNAGKFLTTDGTDVSWSPVAGALDFQGTWNALTNTPTLASGVGVSGEYYITATAGSTNLDGITDWEIGDWLIFNGTVWQKIDQSNLVTSVNGQTGAVSLTTTNINEGTNLYYTDARARAAISAGTAISYDSATGVVTNSAPDQTVSLTGSGSTTVTGTYPNFTIASTGGGTVTSVSGTGTVSGISLSGTVTSSGNLTLGGTLDLSSPPTIGNTTPNTGRFTTLTVDDNTTLGSSNTDTVTFTARINSDFEPAIDNTYDLGRTGHEWRNLYIDGTANIDSLIADTADINAGTIDNTSIGASTASTGAFTTLAASGTTTLSGNQIISVTDNSNAALRITQLGTGNALLVEDSTNPDSTPFVIDAAGRVINGYTASLSIGIGGNLGTQLTGAASASGQTMARFDNSATGARFQFLKSRNATPGSSTIIQNGDSLGTIAWYGDDGAADYASNAGVLAAFIGANIDGTPGTNDMPGRLTFNTTADGASTTTERMRIDSEGRLRQFGTTIVSNVDMLGASYDSVSFSVAGQESIPQAVFFSPDGRKMFVMGNNGDDVNEYTLSTPWLVSSATYVTVFSVAAQETTPTGLFFRADGLKMYVVGQTNDSVFQYALTTPWSIATASYESKSFSVAAQETAPTGLFFRPDGLSMYIAGSTGDSVHQYALTTAWDVSTASFVRSLSVAGQETFPNDLSLTGDGTRMFVLGSTGDDVTVYNLTTPWDISTASTIGQFSVAAQDDAPAGLYVKPDGTKMYVVGQTNDTVFQYTVPSVEIQLTGTTAINGGATVAQDLVVEGTLSGWNASLNGNLGIGTTSPGQKLDVSGSARANLFLGVDGSSTLFNTAAGDNRPLLIGNTNAGGLPNGSLYIDNVNNPNNTTFSFINCVASTQKFVVLGNGTVANGTGVYGTISDERIKKDIVDTSPKLDKLLQVRVVNYTRTDDPTESRQLGVIAQELEQVFPGLVDVVAEKDVDGNVTCPDRKSVKYSIFVPMLIKAIQEQQAIITALTARVEALEAKP